MGAKLRTVGIDIIGKVPWGTHICQFYKTKEDLFDILVPYFKAGLQNNEFCIWITSSPLIEIEVKKTMKKVIPNFDQYIQRGQMEIIPYTLWYLKDDNFNLQRILSSWIDKLSQASDKCYEGIRIAGNTSWLKKRAWRKFVNYEAEVSKKISNYRMIAICSYPLDTCDASEIIDVVSKHQLTFIRRDGRWEAIENIEHKHAKDAICKSEEHHRSIFESAKDAIFRVSKALSTEHRYLSQKIVEIVDNDYTQVRQTKINQSPLEFLSFREQKILKLVVEGKSSKEIADILSLSPKTVETYRSRLMQKLGVDNLPNLVKFAIQHGLTPLK